MQLIKRADPAAAFTAAPVPPTQIGFDCVHGQGPGDSILDAHDDILPEAHERMADEEVVVHLSSDSSKFNPPPPIFPASSPQKKAYL